MELVVVQVTVPSSSSLTWTVQLPSKWSWSNSRIGKLYVLNIETVIIEIFHYFRICIFSIFFVTYAKPIQADWLVSWAISIISTSFDYNYVLINWVICQHHPIVPFTINHNDSVNWIITQNHCNVIQPLWLDVRLLMSLPLTLLCLSTSLSISMIVPLARHVSLIVHFP